MRGFGDDDTAAPSGNAGFDKVNAALGNHLAQQRVTRDNGYGVPQEALVPNPRAVQGDRENVARDLYLTVVAPLEQDLARKAQETATLRADLEAKSSGALTKALADKEAERKKLEDAGKAKDDTINRQTRVIAKELSAIPEYKDVLENQNAQLKAAQDKASEPSIKAARDKIDADRKALDTEAAAQKKFHEGLAKGEDPDKSYLQVKLDAQTKKLAEDQAQALKEKKEYESLKTEFFGTLEASKKEVKAREDKVGQRESAIGVREQAAANETASARSAKEQANQATKMANAEKELTLAERTKYKKALGELMAGGLTPEQMQLKKKELDEEEEVTKRRQKGQEVDFTTTKEGARDFGKILMAGGALAAIGAGAYVAVAMLTGGASLASLPIIMAIAGGGGGLATAALGYQQYRAGSRDAWKAGADHTKFKDMQEQHSSSVDERVAQRALMGGKLSNGFDATSVSRDKTPDMGQGKTAQR